MTTSFKKHISLVCAIFGASLLPLDHLGAQEIPRSVTFHLIDYPGEQGISTLSGGTWDNSRYRIQINRSFAIDYTLQSPAEDTFRLPCSPFMISFTDVRGGGGFFDRYHGVTSLASHLRSFLIEPVPVNYPTLTLVSIGDSPIPPPRTINGYTGGESPRGDPNVYTTGPYTVTATFIDDISGIPEACRTPPTISIDKSQFSTKLILGAISVALGGFVESNSLIDNVNVTALVFGGEPQAFTATLGTPTTSSDGTCTNYRYTWTVSGLPLGTGQNLIKAKATNLVGLSAEASLRLNRDAKPPNMADPHWKVCGECPKRINLATGALDFDPPDIVVPGSTALSLSRFYNSHAAFDGPFGRGWTHGLSIQALRIKNPITGTYSRLIRWATGQRFEFEETGPNTFKGPIGWFLTAASGAPSNLLPPLPPDHLIVTAPDKTIYTFDEQGYVNTIEYRNFSVSAPPKLTFNYGDRHRLQSVATDAGANIVFEYNQAGKVSKATASTGQVVQYFYSADGRNLLLRVVDSIGVVADYAYDEGDRLVTIKDGDGREVMASTYDGLGRAIANRSDGSTSSYSYNDQTQETTVTDSSGRPTVYAWDSNHQFREVSSPDSARTTRDLGPNLEVTSQTDPLQQTTTISYSPSGIVTSARAHDGTTMHVGLASVQGVDRPVSIRFPSEQTATLGYDPSTGFPSFIQAPDGKATLLAGDALGRIKRVQSPTGRAVEATYDPQSGLPTSISDVPNDGTAPATTIVEYNPATGHPTKLRDPLGNATDLVADARGRITSVTLPGGGTVSSALDSAGNPTLVTNARQFDTNLTWDGSGRPTTVTNAKNQTAAFAYTPLGDLNAITNFRGESTVTQYDSVRRPVAVIDALQGVTAFAYDAAGQTTGVTDSRGNFTKMEYDPRGRLKKVTNPGTPQTRVEMFYFPDGELRKVVDELDRETTFTVDTNGRVTSVIDPATKVSSTQYDDDGRVTRTTDTGGRRTDYGYDGLGRLKRLVFAQGTPDEITYLVTFDLAGRLTAIDKTQAGQSGPPRRWSFEYDGRNRLRKQTDPKGGFTETTYDGEDNVLSVDEPGPNGTRLVTSFSYDELDRPLLITRPDETVSISYQDGQVGNPLHSVTSTITRPGHPSVTIVERYDALERLVAEEANGTTTEYEYDANSNVTAMFMTTPSMARTGVQEFAYDVRDRLIAIRDLRANRSISLEYDKAGQLIKQNYSPSGITKDITPGPRGETRTIEYKKASGVQIRKLDFGYDDALQLTSKIETIAGGAPQTTAYAYNLRGQLTSVDYPGQKGERFEYDASGNITRYEKVDGAVTTAENRAYNEADELTAVSGARNITFGYDPRGNLVSQFDGGSTKTFTWDSAGRLLSIGGPTTLAAEYLDDYRLLTLQDGAAPPTTRIWALDNILAEISSTGVEQNFVLSMLEMDTPVERGPPAGTREIVLSDHLMTSLATMNDSGMEIRSSEFSAYGALRSGSDPGTTGYAGATPLGASGLLYLRNRVYDPDLGRFISRDPIGFDGGWNEYSYAHNSPIHLRDPSGEFPPLVLAALVAGTSGAAFDAAFERLVFGTTPTKSQLGRSFVLSALTFGADKWLKGIVGGGRLARYALSVGVVAGSVTALDYSEQSIREAQASECARIFGPQHQSVGDLAAKNALGSAVGGAVGKTVVGGLKVAGRLGGRVVSKLLSKVRRKAGGGDGPLDLRVDTYAGNRKVLVNAGKTNEFVPHHAIQDAASPVEHGWGVTINLQKKLHEFTWTKRHNWSPDYGEGLKGLRKHLTEDIHELRYLLNMAGYGRSERNRALLKLIRANKAQWGNAGF